MSNIGCVMESLECRLCLSTDPSGLTALPTVGDVRPVPALATPRATSARRLGLGHTSAQLSANRVVIATATVGQTALFVGGLHDEVKPSAAVDMYDAATGQWSHTTLPAFASGPSVGSPMASAAVGDKALFCDGATVAIYDGSTGRPLLLATSC
jgi:hypothetical protein